MYGTVDYGTIQYRILLQCKHFFTMLGDRLVEIPSRFSTPDAMATKLEPILHYELRLPSDYITAACKHECAIVKKSRHVKHAHAVWTGGALIQRALMLSRFGQCGIDTTKTYLAEVQADVAMERPEKYSHLDISEATGYSASTLLLHSLPYDYDALRRSTMPPKACPSCNTELINPMRHESLLKRLFSWLTHMGRCGGDGRCAKAHAVVKLAIKRLALCNPELGGMAIPRKQIILEAKHLRSDEYRLGVLYAIAEGLHAKDVAMDVVICSSLLLCRNLAD
jgi:hypothetical protein